jgi:hypothetical protein
MDTLTTPPTDQLDDSIAPVEEMITYGALRLADRCDWCQAQAFVRVVHPTDLSHNGTHNKDLLFCGHHFNRLELAFVEWTIHDERAKIN